MSLLTGYRPLIACVGGLFLAQTPAHAELPQPVRDIIDAAIASGDKDAVETVIGFARQTNPEDNAEIDAIMADFNAEQRRIADEQAAAEEQAIRSAGVFDNWSGRGEIGASRSTGNTDNLGLSIGLKLNREGIDWQHRFRANADLQRSNGRTTKERYFASYEPRFTLNEGAFLFAIAQFERNPFQGYSARYSVSGGIGYRLIDDEGMRLAVKVGPAWRRTDFSDGGGESSIAGLAGLDFDWDITDRLKFTQDANMVANAGGSATVIIDANNTSLNFVSGLEARVSDRLSTRFSYTIDYDSNPPDGKESMDTLSRVTLIYGF